MDLKARRKVDAEYNSYENSSVGRDILDDVKTKGAGFATRKDKKLSAKGLSVA